MQEAVGIYKPKNESFGKFIWNSEKGEFFGRTGTSWLKIGVFYVIFYACLAGFFSSMLAVFYQTIDTENQPTYTPSTGGILVNPALGFRPRPREDNVESTLIWYNFQNPDDIKHWTNELDTFIKAYEGTDDDGQHVRECNFEDYEKEKEDEKTKGTPRDNRACKFQDTWLAGECNKAREWGYKYSAPCVLLKLNRMIMWEPDVYTSLEELPDEMPDNLKETIKNMTTGAGGKVPPIVWVSCQGENPADREYLPNILLSPYPGFPAYYFPYTKIPGYRSPIVGVTFYEPTPNVLINIECRAWAKNILYDRAERLGMVHFELLRD